MAGSSERWGAWWRGPRREEAPVAVWKFRVERQRSAKTCSDECSKKRLRERQKRYDARYRSSDKEGATVTVLNASSETAMPTESCDMSSLVLTRSDDRLLSLVSQLASAGLRLRLSIDGTELEVTQR